MRYKLLGPTGLKVSSLCLGAMTFGEEWGWGSSKRESRRVFDRFTEAGGNFFDTAGNYTNGTSERYLGEFVREDRDRYVVEQSSVEYLSQAYSARQSRSPPDHPRQTGSRSPTALRHERK